MKVLVIYYSYSNNTKRIAEIIKEKLNCDIARIETLNPYTKNYDDVVNQGKTEVNSGFMPEIKPLGVKPSEYDTIIIGTPVWWYTYAPAVKTFLNESDFSGKNIYTFATNGGWVGHTFNDFEKACKGAEIQEQIDIKFNGNTLKTPLIQIENWINRIR